MQRTERNFTECFCEVCIWRYYFLRCRPLSAPKVHLHFLQKECFRTSQSKVRFKSVSWMHRTERSCTDSFCVVFMWTFSFFHYSTLSALNVHLYFLQKEGFRTAQSKLRFNSVSWMHRTVRSFTDFFCAVFIWKYSFSTIGLLAPWMSNCIFYRKRVSELLNQK